MSVTPPSVEELAGMKAYETFHRSDASVTLWRDLPPAEKNRWCEVAQTAVGNSPPVLIRMKVHRPNRSYWEAPVELTLYSDTSEADLEDLGRRFVAKLKDLISR